MHITDPADILDNLVERASRHTDKPRAIGLFVAKTLHHMVLSGYIFDYRQLIERLLSPNYDMQMGNAVAHILLSEYPAVEVAILNLGRDGCRQVVISSEQLADVTAHKFVISAEQDGAAKSVIM